MKKLNHFNIKKEKIKKVRMGLYLSPVSQCGRENFQEKKDEVIEESFLKL